MKQQRGFSLIELMIVVAIVGILSAVAIPLYGQYHDKSKVQAALFEISAARAQYEVQLNDGNTSLTTTDVGLQPSTEHCSLIETTYDIGTGEGTIDCTIDGSAAVKGSVISVKRSSAGAWTCETDGSLIAAIIPSGCT